MKRGIVSLVIIVGVGLLALAPCYNSDSPDCACFNDTATWNPSALWIQDIALDTVGTIESCVSDGGKPFYQMRLGLNSENSATTMALMLETLSAIWPALFDREAWCSETISYWHREAGIPYSTGYRRSSWHLDWQLTNTEAIRTFYRVEEILGSIFFFGGRGRWIDWTDLDYLDFKPGINAPAPGSYVLIRKYDEASATWDGHSHSMMINEMTIHKNGLGQVVQVEVSLLDGNAGSPGRVRDTGRIDDLIAYTPGGAEWLSGERKILGFGVDLDGHGAPIYDSSRLHYEKEEFAIPKPFKPFLTKDPLWERFYEPLIPKLADYAVMMKGGPRVTGPGAVIGGGGIPDGETSAWTFGPELSYTQLEGVEITIDLLQDHPLLIKGIVFDWEGPAPLGVIVRYAADGQDYQEVAAPGIGSFSRASTQLDAPLIPILFDERGATVRRVHLYFPPGSLPNQTKLRELRFIYDWGPGKDAELNPPAIEPGTADGPLSIQISASASGASEGAYSHVLHVSWEVSGGSPPHRITIVITGPDGVTSERMAEALAGTEHFELACPDGGTAQVRVEVEDGAGGSATGMGDVSLTPP